MQIHAETREQRITGKSGLPDLGLRQRVDAVWHSSFQQAFNLEYGGLSLEQARLLLPESDKISFSLTGSIHPPRGFTIRFLTVLRRDGD